MKIGFAFFIFLLCSTHNTHTMCENVSAFKADMQKVTHNIPTSETGKRPINTTAMLIKACQNTQPRPTRALIKFILERGGDVNDPIENTTALLTAVNNPITEEDPYLLEMLIPRATADHINLALMEATRNEKWNTVTLLQERYGAALSQEAVEDIRSSSSDDNISLIKRAAAAAKAGLLNMLKKIHNATSSDENNNDNDDLNAYAATQVTKDMAQQAIAQKSLLNDASMNLMSMGGMPD